ncbi:type VI secretion system-associated protein TagF [Massilia brevitalea]|uniref:type VI secretion system-associated protein TagF n=1 Tax=Massilia brevitalea TaxID=442526 RepID=UPI0027384C33|nr:type VI secretion system-associated protein TagF [Massilia brevitalea]
MMRNSDRIGYFGKIPARSDFVKLAHDAAAIGMLDDWLAAVMQRLPSNARWKIDYDAMAPVSFAFVGPARRHAVAGHLVASHDAPGRRFPFLTMRTLDVADPPAFLSRCVLACAPLWTFLEAAAPQVLAACDPTPHLQGISEAAIALGEADAALSGFLAGATVGSLSDLLDGLDASRTILALGLLLQPVMHSKPAQVDKSLVLPLPDDAALRAQVAAFWLELVAPFVRRTGFDLALFLTRLDGRPVLVIGFCGAAAQTLRAIVDPLVGAEQQVRFADLGWIDEQLGLDVDVRALASYLDQPQLPLKMARELFLKTFIGGAA